MATVQELAQELSKAFVGDTRNDGTNFRKLRDGHPEWMKDVCMTGHGSMFPDDWRYRLIEEAVDAIAENEDRDDAETSIEADVYNHALTDWLASHGARPDYCDEYASEFEAGPDLPIMGRIQGGQYMEKREVFALVYDALEELAGDEEEE